MVYSEEFGYIPSSVDNMIQRLLPFINATFNTAYTMTTFTGTNMYRFVYAICQMAHKTEVDTAEIYNKLQEYFNIINAKILIPRTPLQGLIEQFDDIGVVSSFDQSIAGTLGTCCDVDSGAPDYATIKQNIIDTLALYTVAGLVYVGDESGTYTFSNGQTFTYNFDLPIYIPVLLRATVTISANARTRIFTQQEIRDIIETNIDAKYRLGNDFEPTRYLTTLDLPFAGEIILEYSLDDGLNWSSDVYNAGFKDLFTFVNPDDIEVIIG